MNDQPIMIETTEQFEAVWRAARATRPGSLMAEVDSGARRTRRDSVNARLREEFERSRN